MSAESRLNVEGVGPDDVARPVFARLLVSGNCETNVRGQPNTRRGNVELAVGKAAFTQVDADTTQGLTL